MYMSNLEFHSANSELEDVSEASRDATNKLGSEIETPDLVLVFSTEAKAKDDLLKPINEKFPEARVIGCTTGGEIQSNSVKTGSVTLVSIKGLNVGIGIGKEIKNDERTAGMSAAGKALEDLGRDEYITTKLKRDGIDWKSLNPINFIALSTTLTGNGSEVMRGVKQVLGEGANLAGGLAGDDWKLEQTYVYKDGEIHTDSVVVAALETENQIVHGAKHGLEPSGEIYEVTKSEANRVFELDGESAESVYNDLYGQKGSLPNFIMTKPLGIETSEEEVRLRDPLDIKDDGSIVYAAEVKEGSFVYIMDSNEERMIEAAEDATKNALEKAGNPSKDKIKGAILYDCVCRWNCFKTDEVREKEIEAVKRQLGEDTDVAGWFTYGELALPRALAGVHNQTLVIQLFIEN